ncbi:hypothetical protein [Geodermatophilus marinus]|uniref:hypothetical protein n=1 Tax=Geodermatophilus sp. LHW52908 TaxID=2303986 RepID=UPI0011C175A1|nr:hypothetical protein [Geodermatophilus sp. LHW52908]
MAIETINVGWEFTARDEATGDVPKNLTEEGHALMQALLSIEAANPAVKDSAVSIDTGEGLVTFELSATGAGLLGAIEVALSAIRSAIHTVGGATHDFPTAPEMMDGISFRAGHFEAEPV